MQAGFFSAGEVVDAVQSMGSQNCSFVWMSIVELRWELLLLQGTSVAVFDVKNDMLRWYEGRFGQ